MVAGLLRLMSCCDCSGAESSHRRRRKEEAGGSCCAAVVSCHLLPRVRATRVCAGNAVLPDAQDEFSRCCF